jgi:hypothetical protein
MIWLSGIYGDAIDAPQNQGLDPHVLRALRILRCSPEDADSIWFWQSFENPITLWHTVRSSEAIKDMLNRYVPEQHGNKTPLQLAAVCTASHLSLHHPFQELPDMRCVEGVIAAIIAAGADVHDGDHHHTPLILFLTAVSGNYGGYSNCHPRPRDIQHRLVIWLKIIERNGIDLVAYGAEESYQQSAYRSSKDPKPPLDYWRDRFGVPCNNDTFYFTFSCGPTPEDWRVQMDHMVEQYVGDLWQMPGLLDEDDIRAMPGGWIEDV